MLIRQINIMAMFVSVKSVFTNHTSQVQSYSLKTERTSESICGVSRENGFMFGAEAELTLKTPCEHGKGEREHCEQNALKEFRRNCRAEVQFQARSALQQADRKHQIRNTGLVRGKQIIYA